MIRGRWFGFRFSSFRKVLFKRDPNFPRGKKQSNITPVQLTEIMHVVDKIKKSLKFNWAILQPTSPPARLLCAANNSQPVCLLWHHHSPPAEQSTVTRRIIANPGIRRPRESPVTLTGFTCLSLLSSSPAPRHTNHSCNLHLPPAICKCNLPPAICKCNLHEHEQQQQELGVLVVG